MCLSVHSSLAVWGFPPLETEHKAAKCEFQEHVKGPPHRLRFAQVLWLKKDVPQQAPALYCFCPMGELSSLVMSTCIYTRSVLI